MPRQAVNEPADQMDRRINDFLEKNPKAAEALQLFGVTREQYERVLKAQSRPVFYTASSTNPGGMNGPLD